VNKEMQLNLLVATLDKHKQRASYRAVGGVVGLPAQSVMSGRPKTHENSWVVLKRTGLPSGYSEAEMHSILRSNPIVLSTKESLEAWLKDRA